MSSWLSSFITHLLTHGTPFVSDSHYILPFSWSQLFLSPLSRVSVLAYYSGVSRYLYVRPTFTPRHDLDLTPPWTYDPTWVWPSPFTTALRVRGNSHLLVIQLLQFVLIDGVSTLPLVSVSLDNLSIWSMYISLLVVLT